MSNVTCPYCGQSAELTSSKQVYGGRDYGPIYLCRCRPGWSWVGCHKGTTDPLGRLADRELRYWKQEAHKAFDPIWKNRRMTRSKAYKWLSRELGMEPKHTHIGMFDVDQCKAVIRASKNFFKRQALKGMVNETQ